MSIQDDIVLDGEIYLNGTYFSKTKKDTVTKNRKEITWYIKNKIGVGVACNDKESICIVAGTSKPYNSST